MPVELIEQVKDMGIYFSEGYGLSESTSLGISNPVLGLKKVGSIGIPFPDNDVRLVDVETGKTDVPDGQPGEIIMKGPLIMQGYWNNPSETAGQLKDGWLYTGDIGHVDEDGFLYVLGRVKSLLIANDGEKYSPEVIEEAVTDHSPYIEQFMLFNSQSPYTVALLVPNKEAIGRWLKEKGLSARTPEGQEAVLRLLSGEIDALREGGKFGGEFPGRWLPSAVAVLGEGFTEQNGLLNSTMKMVRGKIADFYRTRIDFLFTPEAKDICNPQNRTIVGRWE